MDSRDIKNEQFERICVENKRSMENQNGNTLTRILPNHPTNPT